MSLAEADWVVQDSEEEDTLDTDVVYDLTRPLAPSAVSSVQHAINSIRSAVSSIESPAFATSPRAPQQTAADTSLISSFTGKVPQHSAGPSTVSVSSTILDTNAPGKSRPKPRPRFKGAAPPLNGANATSSSSIDNSSSLLRTDPADSIRTSTGASAYDGDGIDSFSIADRAKMRSRTNTAVKSAQSAAVTPSSSTSASARKKVKTPPITMEVIEITSEEEDDEMSLFTPRKKKSNDIRPNKRSSPLSKSNASKRTKLSQPAPTSTSTLPPSSMLPPSDPPTSTLARTTTPDLDLPPIATLMVDLTPPQSPVIRKRKRTPPARASALGWQDEGTREEKVMESDVDLDTRKMSPPQHQASPPTFFAASSSSSVDMLDDSSVDLPAEPASKKTKKKVAKPKPKPQPKKTGKKTGVNEAQVAVVVEIKANGKGKGKEKEVFKSKAFIDDEAVVDQAAPSVSVPLPRAETITLPESELSAISDSELEDTAALQRPGKNGKATKRKTTKKVTSRSSKDAPEIESEAEDVVKGPAKRKGKGKVVLSDDQDQDQVDEAVFPAPAASRRGKKGKEKEKPKVGKTHDTEESDREPGKSDGADGAAKAIKENLRPDNINGSSSKPSPTKADTPGPSVSRSFSIASRASTKSTPMSELIRRVNSTPGSPFGASRASSSIYSPYAKSSRTSLMRIAPLHPNRRTPPPPLPRPPPPKKTKKQLMLEEKWEEELAETVEGWACLTDEERAGLRRAKREREMGGYED